MSTNDYRTPRLETEPSWHPLLPAFLLRAEAALLFALSLSLYFRLEGSWFLLLALFFTPDVGMLGYLAGPRVGAMVYNLFHSYPLPTVLAFIGLLASTQTALLVALIWFAHIGFDRLVGYGLKFPSAFKSTHLGWLGR